MSRGNPGNRPPSESWLRRDSWILLGRLFIVAVAVFGIMAVGFASRPVYGPPKAPHGPYHFQPATDVERLTHDVRQAWEIDQAGPIPSASPDSGWGAD